MSDITHLLNTEVTFERKAATRDASGGAVENYAAVAGLTLVAALIQPRSGRPARMLGQRQVLVTHAIYLADASAARRGDRVYHPESGRYFTCHGTEDMAGQLGRVWRVECTQET